MVSIVAEVVIKNDLRLKESYFSILISLLTCADASTAVCFVAEKANECTC